MLIQHLSEDHLTPVEVEIVVRPDGNIYLIPVNGYHSTILIPLADLMIALVNNPTAQRLAGEHEDKS